MQKRNQIAAYLAAFVVVLGLLASPAFAKKDDFPGAGWQKGHKGEKFEIIESSDRAIIKTYLKDNYKPHCPPGLAKKHNGCLPPGQAKKYYRGQVLPAGVVWQPVPNDLFIRLRPP